VNSKDDGYNDECDDYGLEEEEEEKKEENLESRTQSSS
jgi:hypothetical protein